jgi:hypothetical protein
MCQNKIMSSKTQSDKNTVQKFFKIFKLKNWNNILRWLLTLLEQLFHIKTSFPVVEQLFFCWDKISPVGTTFPLFELLLLLRTFTLLEQSFSSEVVRNNFFPCYNIFILIKKILDGIMSKRILFRQYFGRTE